MKTVIERMVDKFLAWKLPEDFGPDCGISFTQYSEYEHPKFGRQKFEPVGTNLFHAGQAKAMLGYVCSEVIEENAKLHEELESVTKERDEALERIKVSQEQPHIGWAFTYSEVVDGVIESGGICFEDSQEKPNSRMQYFKVFAEPVIPPTELELQSQLAAANSRIAVLESATIRQEEAGPGWAELDSVQMP